MIISIFLLLIILLFCCYLPVLFAFHDRTRPLTFAHFWFYLALGLGFLGVFGMICKFIGMNIWFCALPGALFASFSLKKNLFCLIPKIQINSLKSAGAVFAIAASAVSIIYLLIAGALMGTGVYPPVFFNVDSAYYLGQIHSLIRYDSWPPLSLSFLGAMKGYHYGSQSICAVLSMLTGIAPHTVTFMVYVPLTQLAIVCAVWLVVATYRNEKNILCFWWCIPFLLFSNFYPIFMVLKQFSQTSFHQAIYSSLLNLKDPQMFQGHYPMLSTHFGYLLVFGCILCFQNYSRAASRIFLALLVGIAIVYKSPIYVVLLLGFSLWTLYEVIKTRRLSHLGPLLLSLIVAICLYLIAGPGGSSAWVFVPLQYFLGSPERIIDTLGTILLYAIPGLLLLIALRKNIATFGYVGLSAAFIIPAFIFLQLFGLSQGGDLNSNIYQILVVLPIFAAVASISLIMTNWDLLTTFLQRAIIVLLIIITVPPLGHRLAHTAILIFFPERGHEYTDNHLLAGALANIPLSDSVIVTNDFRYPAQNYKRDLRQLQFPAIFGHQMYASNFVYEHYDDSERRLALQYRLRDHIWDAEMEQIARQEGWTHLVIHRASPHAQKIPLSLIFENSEYQVYKYQ